MNYLINQVLYRKDKKVIFWGRLQKEAAILTLIVMVLAACATVPHTGRRQLNMVSDNQLNSIALKAFNDVVSKEKACNDERFNQAVKQVSDRISKAAESVDKPGFAWDVKVIEKDTPNAFCLPGGKIVVFTGLMPYVKNEAGLAAVIGHEVAHAVARHGGERLTQQLAVKGAVTVGGEILKGEDGNLDQKSRLLLAAVGMGGTVGVILPYSRLHETEADRIGQIYMASAGYDPTESVRLWERMAKITKPPIPEWLSTHPADGERVRKLNESLPEAQKFYAKAPAKYGLGMPL